MEKNLFLFLVLFFMCVNLFGNQIYNSNLDKIESKDAGLNIDKNKLNNFSTNSHRNLHLDNKLNLNIRSIIPISHFIENKIFNKFSSQNETVKIGAFLLGFF